MVALEITDGEKKVCVRLHPKMFAQFQRAAIRDGFVFEEAYLRKILFQHLLVDFVLEKGVDIYPDTSAVRKELHEWMTYTPSVDREQDMIENTFAAIQCGYGVKL